MPRSSTCRPMAAASDARRRSRTTAGSGSVLPGWKRNSAESSGTVRNSSASNLKSLFAEPVFERLLHDQGQLPETAISESRNIASRTHWLARQAGDSDIAILADLSRKCAVDAVVEGLRRGEGGATSRGDAASEISASAASGGACLAAQYRADSPSCLDPLGQRAARQFFGERPGEHRLELLDGGIVAQRRRRRA